MKKYYTGRKKITIPVSRQDFLIDPLRYIKHYLANCVSQNNDNLEEAKDLKDFYKGLQGIWGKSRLNNDNTNNNTIEVNHIFRQVEFKKGFMVGNPINYSLGVDKSTDDMTYLNKYFKDSNKASLDIDKYEDLYVAGISEQFIVPKTYDYDVESEAPFELYNLEIGTGFKVFSADVTSFPLFDVIINEIVDKTFQKKKQYSVFFINPNDNKTYSAKFNENKQMIESSLKKEPYNFLPVVESQLNKNRMGIVELVISIQDGLNIIHSNQTDDIVDFVNAYLVFENQSMESDWEEKVKTFRKNRAIAIKSNNPQLPAKVSLLKQTLQHTEINAFYELMKKEMYDIVAVPQSSGGVTSGGDTGEARILGNGWESAQNQAKVDITYALQFEYDLLKKIISVCKEAPNSVTKEITASDIDIKYSINMSNNILTKTQALSNLYAMHIPYEKALGLVGITNDEYGLAIEWEKSDKEAKTIAMQMQSKNLSNGATNNNNNNQSGSDSSD